MSAFLQRLYASFLAKPTFLALSSGILLALAFPRWNLTPLAWFALVPLAVALLKQSVLSSLSFRHGFLAGFTFWLVTLHWLLWLGATADGIPRLLAWILTVLAWFALSAVCAIFFGLWTTGLSALGKRFSSRAVFGGVAISALGSAAWVTLEWLRAHIWVGFPWNQLGVSQWQNIAIIQIADFSGVYGVSFLLCFVNLALACFLGNLRAALSLRAWGPRIMVTVAAALVLAALSYAFVANRPTQPTVSSGDQSPRSLSVTVVQANIAQSEKWRDSNEQEIRDRYADLTRTAAISKPNLIVWPETATPLPLNFDRATFDTVTTLARETKTSLLVGTIDGELDASGQPTGVGGNAAFFVRADGQLAMPPYWKMRLVPFGEYMPMNGVFPALGKFVPFPGIVPGRAYRVFEADGAKFSVLICFEDVFASQARQFVQRDAQFLVNITNDAWWGRSAGAEQHAANSVFRAVENRVPLVRAANTGLSCVIDPTGRISNAVPLFTEGFATSSITLPAERRLTFYMKYGDVFALACLATVAAWLAGEGLAYARKRHRNIAERR